jgi:hypothetical protein
MSYDLDHCKICKKPLNEALKNFAHQRIVEVTCSTKCSQTETKRRFACCEKATFLSCVCAYAFRCKKHGDTHIGTHD